jgi:hypothetical protein
MTYVLQDKGERYAKKFVLTTLVNRLIRNILIEFTVGYPIFYKEIINRWKTKHVKYTLWSHKIDILYNEEKQYWRHKRKEFQILIRNHNEIKHIINRYYLDQDIYFVVITFYVHITPADKAANDVSFYVHIIPADKAANDVSFYVHIVPVDKAANDVSFYVHIVPADKAANDVSSLLLTFTFT